MIKDVIRTGDHIRFSLAPIVIRGAMRYFMAYYTREGDAAHGSL